MKLGFVFVISSKRTARFVCPIDLTCYQAVNFILGCFAHYLPWVPEPQNLNETKLVRGKERRKKGGYHLKSARDRAKFIS